jgi:UDP-N-acetylglucosamine--N-acetylmuramyl-(pentapeptide) pyrophosphoryl-undecaprenol N-acetylglucosamine transferase
MAIAIAQQLKSRHPSIDALFAGTEEGLESRIVPSFGFKLETINIGGLKKVGALQKLRTLFQLPLSFASSLRIVRRFSPQVVVGVGGYSSGPLVLASCLLRVPTLIIEPNVYPGFTNRILSRFATRAAVAFEETASWFGQKAKVTGVPVRSEFFEVPSKRSPRTPPTLLIYGGSRGSQPINQLIVSALPFLSPEQVSIIHQTGPPHFDTVSSEYQASDFPAEVLPYIDNMPDYFAKADMLLCRAGASTMAEITAAGKPAILIPFPHATDDHQRKNAEALAIRHAAVLVHQGSTDGPQLATTIKELASESARLTKMSVESRKLAKPRATETIVELMEEIAK